MKSFLCAYIVVAALHVQAASAMQNLVFVEQQGRTRYECGINLLRGTKDLISAASLSMGIMQLFSLFSQHDASTSISWSHMAGYQVIPLVMFLGGTSFRYYCGADIQNILRNDPDMLTYDDDQRASLRMQHVCYDTGGLLRACGVSVSLLIASMKNTSSSFSSVLHALHGATALGVPIYYWATELTRKAVYYPQWRTPHEPILANNMAMEDVI